MFDRLLAPFKEHLRGVTERVQHLIKTWLAPQSQSPDLDSIGDMRRSRSGWWIAQQIREAVPLAQTPRILLPDNDRKYGHHVWAVTEKAVLGRDVVQG